PERCRRACPKGACGQAPVVPPPIWTPYPPESLRSESAGPPLRAGSLPPALPAKLSAYCEELPPRSVRLRTLYTGPWNRPPRSLFSPPCTPLRGYPPLVCSCALPPSHGRALPSFAGHLRADARRNPSL